MTVCNGDSLLESLSQDFQGCGISCCSLGLKSAMPSVPCVHSFQSLYSGPRSPCPAVLSTLPRLSRSWKSLKWHFQALWSMGSDLACLDRQSPVPSYCHQQHSPLSSRLCYNRECTEKTENLPSQPHNPLPSLANHLFI